MGESSVVKPKKTKQKLKEKKRKTIVLFFTDFKKNCKKYSILFSVPKVQKFTFTPKILNLHLLFFFSYL